jgi:ADP-ribosylglycohydrolase
VDELTAGWFLRREPRRSRSGYVVRSLEAALWGFARGASFREGALLAANLGDNADTTMAVYGQHDPD